MQDDFDSEMGMPDDELAGGSAMSDSGEAGLGGTERAEGVALPLDDQRGDAHACQHRAHVDVEVADRVHRLERAGAQRKALEPRAPGER